MDGHLNGLFPLHSSLKPSQRQLISQAAALLFGQVQDRLLDVSYIHLALSVFKLSVPPSNDITSILW